MNVGLLFVTLAIGLVFWGGWPLVTQGVKSISDPYVRGFLVSAVTTLGFLPFLPGRISASTFTSKGIWVLVIGGMLNLGGHALFPRLQTAEGSQASLYLTMIPALCIVAAAVGGPLFYGDTVSLSKTFFTLLILVGVIGLAITSLR